MSAKSISYAFHKPVTSFLKQMTTKPLQFREPISLSPPLTNPVSLPSLLPPGLPNEKGRLEILQIHTSHMRKHKKLDAKVDLQDLAERTRNFSGAEIEGLVRSAQATAMNRMIKVISTSLQSTHYSISLSPHRVRQTTRCRWAVAMRRS